nr:hypothetical protein [Actinomycetota bacterium]
AVATAFAAHALMDVAEACDEPRLAELALEAVDYAAAELVVERDGERWFGYYAGSTSAIHNSSLLLASVFARALEPGDPRLEPAADAVRFTIARQRDDGSWPYGEEPSLAWVDGFHSAYNLDALDRWHVATGDDQARAAVERGLALYLDRLLDPDGAARASLERRHPVDVHACATAITTLARLAASGWDTLDRAGAVLDWTLANMRRRDGRFAFQRHRFHRNPVPYVRWGDGHMMVALATYAEAAS